jgi:hypothetical protein
MPLTELTVRNAKPADRLVKLSDGSGLQLWVFPDGTKRWRLAYRVGGSQKALAIRVYPEVELKDAREAREAAKKVLAGGGDPMMAKKQAKAEQAIASANTFQLIAAELVEKKREEDKADRALSKTEWLLSLAYPEIGARPIRGIRAPDILRVLRGVAARGRFESASLVEQWQEEMAEKFGLHFDLLTRDQIESSVTGNPFVEKNRLILRLDMAARSDELKAKLEAAGDWDLIICDEAHRMAASYFGGEVKETQRHKLGKLLGTRTRNFLLMSATPHNGKGADFQLFIGLLDADRFEGRFREGVHKADVSDMMRRLTKEELCRFDGTPLFPERRAYTASFAFAR